MLREIILIFYVYDRKPVKKIISFSKLNVSGLLLKKSLLLYRIVSSTFIENFLPS